MRMRETSGTSEGKLGRTDIEAGRFTYDVVLEGGEVPLKRSYGGLS